MVSIFLIDTQGKSMRPILCLFLLALQFILSGTGPVSSYPQCKKISGGASNHNFVIRTKNSSFFMRLSNQSVQTLENEYACSTIAARSGIAPAVISYKPDQGIMITEFLPNSRTIDLKDPATLAKALDSIRHLHELSTPFPRATSPFELAYSQIAAVNRGAEKLNKVVLPALRRIEEASPPQPSTPCHLDLHSGNLIDNGEKIWVIDWEYAAMSDPLFDLATLASTEDFTDEEMKLLLKLYNPQASMTEYTHLYNMRILADARWCAWSFVQAETSSVDYPFEKDGERFLQSCLSRID